MITIIPRGVRDSYICLLKKHQVCKREKLEEWGNREKLEKWGENRDGRENRENGKWGKLEKWQKFRKQRIF